ncbi:MAG: pyridoxamine 5'-phosphate oxidase family protein [Bacteroidia bacterium]|nr:pyridoxamine 5'-phosphate oxidase family protein [Bacteroidia bacterium]
MNDNLPEKRIVDFIKKHHVLTLATSSENEIWCANCFYAYSEEDNCLIFTSDIETRHIKDALNNPFVAGSIVLETSVVGKIQGIQFQGILSKPKKEDLDKVKKRYLYRFPVATLMETTLWSLELTLIKMTDNRLGFGKKLIWKKLI